jgi:tetratricopeptide (TPR) repeat protein
MPDIKYRAFLSYSHKDRRIADRVHARLEGFRIGKDLRGRLTSMGPIPPTLYPIFRDRNDFDAGGALGELTIAALDASAALIVVASPDAAKSHYVDEEVRLFATRCPDRPIIPLIVAGEPGGGDRECFPPALQALAGPADAKLAADLREEGDGFALALAKIVAKLIGLSPDDVFRRMERERRRQNRVRFAVAAVILALALAGGLSFRETRQQGATLAEINALVERYSAVPSAQGEPAGGREALKRAITAIAEGAATDPRYAKALELLKAGKPADAEPLLKAVAEDRARRAENDAKESARAYRTLASIAAVSDPGHARDYYAEAAKLDPSDIEGMVLYGTFEQDAGNLAVAESAYRRVIDLGKSGGADHEVYWATLGLGDIQHARGDVGAALATYREAGTVMGRLASSDPGNAGWQRDLSVSYNKVGDVLVAQGNLPDALKSFRDGLAIATHLASSDPGNANWQRDLLVSYEKVGDVLVAQGNLPDALKSFGDGLAIAARLASSDPGDAGWQRDLSVSYERVGDVLVAQGNLPEALKSYRDGQAIFARLASSDPGNAGWQRDLSLSYDRVGNVLVAQGNLPGALDSYRDGQAILARLASSDPGNAGWQSDLSVTEGREGDILIAQGNLPDALKSYRDGLAILARLAASDPSNANWQHDLSIFYSRLAYAHLRAGQVDDARAALAAGRAIIVPLVAKFPGQVQWKNDLAALDRQIAQIGAR